MVEFAEKLMQALLSWTQNIYTWFWENAMGAGEGGFADWFAENWMRVTIIIIIVGVLMDLVVWTLRRRSQHKKADKQESDDAYNRFPEDAYSIYDDDFIEDEFIAPQPETRTLAETDALDMEEEIGLSDNIVSSVQDIVTRERVDISPKKLETQVRVRTVQPGEPVLLQTEELLAGDNLLGNIPHVHVKQDTLKENSPYKGQPFWDMLARGTRILRRHARAAGLRMRLKFSSGRG